ncbi:MAG: ribose-5-phosphate isomerase RpiA [archaeon]
MSKEKQKENAAREAIKFVKDGMIVGLGTGSTTDYFVKLLAERVKEEKLQLTCVSTSKKTNELAAGLGLKVVGINEVERIDVAVDGADQVDRKKRMLKGLGGYAFLREKEVDYKAEKLIIIIDEGKLSRELDKEVLIEVAPALTEKVIRELIEKFDEAEIEQITEGCAAKETDNKNYVVKMKFPEPIKNPEKIEKEIDLIRGVKANGIFNKKCIVIIGKDEGVEVLN